MPIAASQSHTTSCWLEDSAVPGMNATSTPGFDTPEEYGNDALTRQNAPKVADFVVTD